MWKFNELRNKQIERLKSFSERLFDKYIRKDEIGFYDDLSPLSDINEVDSKANYREALNFALDNRNITNFAITGPYGSGKSSLIKSYFEYKDLSREKYMTVTLSTFETKSEKGDKPINEIESSILEQIIYNKEEASHKYSRLNRINAPRKGTLIKNFIGVLFFIITISSIFSDAFSSTMINIINTFLNGFGSSFTGLSSISNDLVKSFLLSLIIIIDITVLFSLFNKLRFISKVTFAFDKSTFELSSSNGDSLLDKHIDEIYNFFKHNKYRIVVFEDLDRYHNVDIFERLKRINRLINNSRTFSDKNDQIKFLYTVGDHLFENDKYKERTKFFDFVIPLVPVINTRNSFYELNKKFETYSEKQRPDKSLLKDTSFYIDDMRTLKNIMNEYKTYYNLLINKDDKYFSNKVFSIICLKNRYPSEFVKFQKNKGDLIGLIKRIDELKLRKIFVLEEYIQEIEQDIINVPQELSKTKMQVDDVFRMHLYRMSPNGTIVAKQGNSSIMAVNNRNSLLTETDIGRLFSGDSIIVNGSPIDFENANTLGGTSLPYNKRVQYVELKSDEKMIALKDDLKELRVKRQLSTYQNWNEVIKENLSDSIITKFKDDYPMVFYFIYSGYIEKDYIRYLGFFKEGHMTNKDTEFISAIRIMQDIEPDYKIDNPNEVVEELVTEDYTNVKILNFYLIQYLINNKDERLDLVLDARSKELKFMVEFVNGYLDWYHTNNITDNSIDILIRTLYHKYDNLWKYIVDNEAIIEMKTHHFIDYSLGCLISTKDFIDDINHNTIHIIRYIQGSSNINNLFKYCTSDDVINLIKLYIEESTFAVDDLSALSEKTVNMNQLFDYIVENSLYRFNSSNIVHLLNRINEKDQTRYNFAELYSFIIQEQFINLKRNIENHKEIFVRDYLESFLFNGVMTNDALVYLLETLCNKLEQKVGVISHIDKSVRLNKISEVTKETYPLLMESKHIEPSFENIFKYLDEFSYDDVLEQFINEFTNELLTSNIDAQSDKKYVLIILNATRSNKIIEFIRSLIGDLELSLYECSTNIPHLIDLLRYGFNFIVDEEIGEILNDNEKLLHSYLKHYYKDTIYADIGIYIPTDVSSDLYQSDVITIDEFIKLCSWQVDHFQDQPNYLKEASLKLNKSKFVMILDEVNSVEERLGYLHAFISENEYSRDFLIDTLIKIDVSYEVFKTKPHFVVENSVNLKLILDEITETIITKYNVQDNGKLHVYIKRKGVLV